MTDATAPQPVFSIEKLYVKDISLESPNAPQVFLDREQPELDIQLNTVAHNIGEDLFEAALTATITAKAKDKTHFLLEISQAGIFRLQHIPKAEMEPVLAIACPNILFPYLREAVSDIAQRGGFPPVLLAPVSFEVLYQQRAAQQAAAAQAADTAEASKATVQ